MPGLPLFSCHSLVYSVELIEASGCYKHVHTEEVPILGDNDEGVA